MTMLITLIFRKRREVWKYCYLPWKVASYLSFESIDCYLSLEVACYLTLAAASYLSLEAASYLSLEVVSYLSFEVASYSNFMLIQCLQYLGSTGWNKL